MNNILDKIKQTLIFQNLFFLKMCSFELLLYIIKSNNNNYYYWIGVTEKTYTWVMKVDIKNIL